MKAGIISDTLLKSVHLLLLPCLLMLSAGCGEKAPSEKDIVVKPELMEDRLARNLRAFVAYAGDHEGYLNDSTRLHGDPGLVQRAYEESGYAPLWSDTGTWRPVADTLYWFITTSKAYGLFPPDYHYGALKKIHRQLLLDTLARKDAALWSRADLLMTDALLRIALHLKRGRLPYDSLSIRKDTPIVDGRFYLNVLDQVQRSRSLMEPLLALEPSIKGYRDLREALQVYADTTVFRFYTYLPYPVVDTADFYFLLRLRLREENIPDSLLILSDTGRLYDAVAAYQAREKLKVTGKVNQTTVSRLNNNSWERYKRIAISLDKYKLMPDSMPETYVWVNIPSYYLTVVDNDTVVLRSKTIVGASATPTPELVSQISNFITYPQWTVPYSIVFKEMLPKIRKDTNYLKKENLMVVDRYDSVIAPSTINWASLNKNKFPYTIRQREGDDNSLGVLKFNFRNKYSVYLHDTNARWLFSKSERALSHGCIRVQQWRAMANFLVRNDTIKYHPDTLSRWIARQEKHTVSGFKKVPVYIRYFTCEGVDGQIRFYDDIYAEDKMLAEKYFSHYIN